MKNKAKYVNNASGVVGVSFYKKLNKWAASIGVKGRRVYLGYYEDMKDAVKARQEAERRYGFHKNHGRETSCE